MSDFAKDKNVLISRQAAVDEIHQYFLSQIDKEETKIEGGWEVYADINHVNELLTHNQQICTKIKALPSAEPRWIPVKTRPMTEEERWYWEEHTGVELEAEDAVFFDCQMPDDGQEVWVCYKSGTVSEDVCERDDFCGLEGNGDWSDIVAWMPRIKPEPWKGEE